MTQPRWLDERESAMWMAFHDMRRHLDQAVEHQLKGADLSSAEFEVLGPLSRCSDGIRARDLGNAIGWDRSRLAHMLRRMEQRGLLERTACEDDNRGTVVTITSEGRSLLEAAAPGHVATVRAYFIDLLAPDEIDLLLELSRRVRHGQRSLVAGVDA